MKTFLEIKYMNTMLGFFVRVLGFGFFLQTLVDDNLWVHITLTLQPQTQIYCLSKK